MKEAVYSTSVAELFATPLPKETRTYKPVSHKQIHELILDSIVKSGFSLKSFNLNHALEGKIANGKYRIASVADSEMMLEVGWQNSYNKQLSLKFAIGANIFICQNGMVVGDMGAFKKKHMGTIKTFAPLEISESIKSSGKVFEQMQKERDLMKVLPISKRVQAELVGRMFIEQDLINSTQLNIIKNEIKDPTFDYECDGSLWELYNHTTFSMKELHPRNWMESHMKVHEFFKKNSDLYSIAL
jgi:hypothetical protein